VFHHASLPYLQDLELSLFPFQKKFKNPLSSKFEILPLLKIFERTCHKVKNQFLSETTECTLKIFSQGNNILLDVEMKHVHTLSLSLTHTPNQLHQFIIRPPN
jgi:hypothetical protein